MESRERGAEGARAGAICIVAEAAAGEAGFAQILKDGAAAKKVGAVGRQEGSKDEGGAARKEEAGADGNLVGTRDERRAAGKEEAEAVGELVGSRDEGRAAGKWVAGTAAAGGFSTVKSCAARPSIIEAAAARGAGGGGSGAVEGPS